MEGHVCWFGTDSDTSCTCECCRQLVVPHSSSVPIGLTFQVNMVVFVTFEACVSALSR
jgi:hypothetical protein